MHSKKGSEGNACYSKAQLSQQYTRSQQPWSSLERNCYEAIKSIAARMPLGGGSSRFRLFYQTTPLCVGRCMMLVMHTLWWLCRLLKCIHVRICISTVPLLQARGNQVFLSIRISARVRLGSGGLYRYSSQAADALIWASTRSARSQKIITLGNRNQQRQLLDSPRSPGSNHAAATLWIFQEL